MTAQDRSTLKADFETGDVPDGTNYGNLIDSFLNLTDTSAQTVASPVMFSGSAAFTGTVSANTLAVSGAVTAGSLAVLGDAGVSGAMSAGSANIVGVMTAGSANITGGAVVSGAFTAGSLAVLGALRVSAATSLEGTLAVVTAQTTTTASGAVGGSAVPATATKYLKVSVSGVTYNVALYPSV